MRIRVLVAGLLQAGLMACGQGAAPVKVERQELEARDAAAADHSSPESGATSPSELSTRSDYPDPASGMIIRTGNASIELDSLSSGLGALRGLALRLGGYVANVSLQGGREQIRSATLEIKVPAGRFDELTAGLDQLGRVEFVNVSAQDVGEEFVDLSARAANARRLEERLIDVLGTRTGKLQDVLSVERELARIREEIERLDGRMRYLKSRAALSTLSVTLHEPPPIVGDNPGRSIVAEAFRRAWRNFVAVLAGAIASLGFVVPVAGVVGAVILLARKVRRTA